MIFDKNTQESETSLCNPGAGRAASSRRAQGSHSVSLQGPMSLSLSLSLSHTHTHTHTSRSRVRDHGGSGEVFHRRLFTHPHRGTVTCIRSCTHTQTAMRSCEWAFFTSLSFFSLSSLSPQSGPYRANWSTAVSQWGTSGL